MKLKVAAICGGYSSEKIISMKSIETIVNHLDRKLYDVYKVVIDETGWHCVTGKGRFPVNKNQFGVDELNIEFDFAYIMIHGSPGEDGKLQAYLEMMNIPFAGCTHLMSTLTFDKWACNHFLRSLGIDVASSILIRPGASYNKEAICENLGLPIFVKPNDGGSSFGVSKVNEVDELDQAVRKAMAEGSNAILESFIEGYEITIGAFKDGNGLHVLPITQILTDNVFFDFEAKYEGASSEITPANIPEEDAQEARKIVAQVYEALGLSGIVRIDFMVNNGRPVLIEINTVPGFSEASIVPQQLAADGRDIGSTLSNIIDWTLKAK